MKMSEKCNNNKHNNNNSDNPLTSRRTDGGKNIIKGWSGLDFSQYKLGIRLVEPYILKACQYDGVYYTEDTVLLGQWERT